MNSTTKWLIGTSITIFVILLGAFSTVHSNIKENDKLDTQTIARVASLEKGQSNLEKGQDRIEGKVDQLLWDNGHNPQTIVNQVTKKP